MSSCRSRADRLQAQQCLSVDEDALPERAWRHRLRASFRIRRSRRILLRQIPLTRSELNPWSTLERKPEPRLARVRGHRGHARRGGDGRDSLAREAEVGVAMPENAKQKVVRRAGPRRLLLLPPRPEPRIPVPVDLKTPTRLARSAGLERMARHQNKPVVMVEEQVAQTFRGGFFCDAASARASICA